MHSVKDYLAELWASAWRVWKDEFWSMVAVDVAAAIISFAVAHYFAPDDSTVSAVAVGVVVALLVPVVFLLFRLMAATYRVWRKSKADLATSQFELKQLSEPRFELIGVKNNETYNQGNGEMWRSIYVKLVVKATGARVKDCQAFLEEVACEYKGKSFLASFTGPIELKWGMTDDHSVDLAPDVARYVDVLACHKSMMKHTEPVADTIGLPPEIATPNSLRFSDFFEYHGTYRFTVAVTAEDAPTRRAIVCVVWLGEAIQGMKTFLEPTT